MKRNIGIVWVLQYSKSKNKAGKKIWKQWAATETRSNARVRQPALRVLYGKRNTRIVRKEVK